MTAPRFATALENEAIQHEAIEIHAHQNAGRSRTGPTGVLDMLAGSGLAPHRAAAAVDPPGAGRLRERAIRWALGLPARRTGGPVPAPVWGDWPPSAAHDRPGLGTRPPAGADAGLGYVDLGPLVQAIMLDLHSPVSVEVRDDPLPVRASTDTLRQALVTLFTTLDRAEPARIEAYLSVAQGRHYIDGPAAQVHLVVRASGARLSAGAIARFTAALVRTQSAGLAPRLRVQADRTTIDSAALVVDAGPDDITVAASWPVDLG